MGKIFWLAYRYVISPFYRVVYLIAGFFDPKVEKGLVGRKGLFKNLRKATIPEHTKRILIHCASVGEWEQALPIIHHLKKLDNTLFIAVSFFSPSGYNYSGNHPLVDFKFYLPFDTYGNAKRLFKLIRPDLWIISKFDVWPSHLMAAGKLTIPVLMIDATLSEDSGRDKGIVKTFSRYIYKNFDYLFPISGFDADRFYKIFPFRERMAVTGDTRFDQVKLRAQKAIDAGKINLFKSTKNITLILGSTWPQDEEEVLPATINLLKKYGQLQVIAVPHEIGKKHLNDIEEQFSNSGFEPTRYTQIKEATDKRVVVIDVIGVLARLYQNTDVAFVGGSFGKTVHNVMEPAVFGQPVLFGPDHVNSFEALELKKIGAAFSVENGKAFEEKVHELITNDELRRKTGKLAKDLIDDNLGASEKIMNILKERYL
ncbi:MAG TPA: 3-deoxy-D-manno-octulosonic acid transferase [Cyclobacteriaceae bacterium]